MRPSIFQRYGTLMCLLLLAAACRGAEEPDSEKVRVESQEGPHVGTVTELIPTEAYSYICVRSGSESYWLAANRVDVAVGDELSFEGTTLMRDFHSPTLDRTFPAILFVDRAWVTGSTDVSQGRTSGLPSGHPPVPSDDLASSPRLKPSAPDGDALPPLPDGKTVAEIFQKRKTLAGDRVRVVGKVMKVNANIMGRNWIHVQDGTSAEGFDDLVVTSTDSAPVGSIVVVEGILAVDKSFEVGYHFQLLVEESVLTVVNPG